jgi:hypothetical protein
VPGGCLDRVQVGALAGRGLDSADRDEVHTRLDRLGEVPERDEPDRDAAIGLRQEGEEHRREISLRRDDRGARRQRCRDEAREGGDLAADADRSLVDADEPGECRPGRADDRIEVLRSPPSCGPIVERGTDRRHRCLGRDADGGRVEVPGLDREGHPGSLRVRG